VCQVSGLLPSPNCPTEKEIFFADGGRSTVPQAQDTFYKRLTIDTRNGLLATDATPIDARVDRLFFDYPADAQAWAKSQGLPLPPTASDGGSIAATAVPSGLVIVSPAPLSAVHHVVTVTGDIAIAEAQSFTLAYGAGLNPTRWINVPGSGSLPPGGGQALTLGQWDTSGLDGLYTLRLQATLRDHSIRTITSQVTVNNVPPTIALLAPQAGTHFAGKTIAVAADAKAHLPQGLHVTFYRVDSTGAGADEKLGTAIDSPFTFTWTIPAGIAGKQTLYAVATDSAGNTTKSTPVTVVIDRP